jgi:hypothetical protein
VAGLHRRRFRLCWHQRPEQLVVHTGSLPGRYQSASLWWPNGRAWFVGTEIDLNSTYVGGSSLAIEALLATPDDLEAFPVGRTIPSMGLPTP